MSISSFSSSDRSISSSSSSTAPSTRASLTSRDRYLLDLHTHTQTQAENDVYNRTIHINHLVRYYGHSDWTSVPALEDSDLSMHDFNEVLHGPRGGKFILRQWVMFGEGERAFEVCRRGGRRVYVSVEVAIVKGLEEDRRRVEGVNGSNNEKAVHTQPHPSALEAKQGGLPEPDSVRDMARSTSWAAQGSIQCAASQTSRQLPAATNRLSPFTTTTTSASTILQQLGRRSATSPPPYNTRAYSSKPSRPPQAAPRTAPTSADSVSIPPPTPSSASSSPSNGARVPSKTPPKQADKVPMPQPLPFQKPNPSISPKELNAFAVSQLTARSGPGAGAKSSRKMDPKVSWEERYRTRARKYA
ncbi:hypothetical protein H2199_003840 [Coniosporium tulheliwenetii]|uniref:Uncharacterized protein n=1 Tax=Coniosporium tulheliwenetii TaxID=3383036 RepID=A0ACC2Z8K6_9PEZI|nr:hypothetical protein H2199_003840 [Cladosporium sp. JES 115]